MHRIIVAVGVLFTLICLSSSVRAAKPQISNLEWHLTRVGAPTAWAEGATGKGVSILVIDTGLDQTMATTVLYGSVLPLFSPNPLHGKEAIPCPIHHIYYSGPCFKPKLITTANAHTDEEGHGSFVSCEIVCHGLKYNYYGIAPEARVSMAKVFDHGIADPRDIATAIRWGAINRFPIENLSLGSTDPDIGIRDAVKFALSQGTLIVAAAGNDGGDILEYPASYPGVIKVSSTDKWDNISVFSNFGDNTSIASPGDWIFSICPDHPSDINCGGLATLPGTSMSTPLVSGALADLLSLGLTTNQAESALLIGARKWPGQDSDKYGHGILDLQGSIRYAQSQGWINK